MTQAICSRLSLLLRSVFLDAYGRVLDDTLKDRNRDLWIVGIDSDNGRFVDVCGDIGLSQISAMNAGGVANNDAGFRADAHLVNSRIKKEVDVFLLHVDHFSDTDDLLHPLIAHELAHYLEQIGETPTLMQHDTQNAGAILFSLEPGTRKRHTSEWAQWLAVGARTIVSNKSANFSSIRQYLELAIPDYDRVRALSIVETSSS